MSIRFFPHIHIRIIRLRGGREVAFGRPINSGLFGFGDSITTPLITHRVLVRVVSIQLELK